MTERMLSLAARPQTFDDLVGQKHLAKMIRGHMASKRVPAAWMFIGESGAGKTTVARILATSLQCTHQEEFGNPCEACRKNQARFDIVEINAAEHSGVEETEQVIQGANYHPKPPSLYRVYIFDEAHNLSKVSQTALLKYFEDSPKSTVWIICTTEPQKILRTLRRRCISYTIPSLGVSGVGTLVKRTLMFAGVKSLNDELLTEALLEAGVTSPGFIVAAVEKYIAGETAEKAAQVGNDSAIDTLKVCRAVVKGDWAEVRQILAYANPEDARAIRGSLGGYLKAIMLNSDGGAVAKNASDALYDLMRMSSVEDGLQLSGTVATLYKLCKTFGRG
jgi:DNA polymerase III subunit gamma/tau